MSSRMQDSPFGQIIRYATKGRVFGHAENKPDFQLPWEREDIENSESEKQHEADAANESDKEKDKELESDQVLAPRNLHSTNDRHSTHDSEQQAPSGPVLDEGPPVHQQTSNILRPAKTPEGIILIDWYDTNDQANPQNWNWSKKFTTAAIINLYTFGVYSCSSIITPAHNQIMERFNVSYATASLGLSMYVIGYGIGPLLFCPLQEIPRLGRNLVYIITFALYVILAVPTALVDNFAGLIVLRFITGFLGSPCLATGAASQGDMFSFIILPLALLGWTASAFAGPSFGPVISGFAVQAKNWRWSLWPILWLNAPIWLLMFFFFPETYAPNILYRRAQRLRKVTGNNNLRSQSEIDQGQMSLRKAINNQLIKPFEITFKDPSVFFVNFYTAFLYGIYYSFFEAFPIAYAGTYGFNIGQTSLTFISLAIGCLAGCVVVFLYQRYYLIPDLMKRGPRANEHRLVPALFASTLLPASMFWWGWTSDQEDIHWIVGLIAVAVFTLAAFVLMQCIFIYLPMSYPQYAASLFAANDFFRSAMAGGAIEFARPLYNNLGVGRGISVVAGLCGGCVLGVFALYFFGARLRAKSKFAVG